MRGLGWLTAPWFSGDRRAEERERRRVSGTFAERGIVNSGEHESAIDDLHRRYRSRRLRMRILGALVVVVAAASFLAAFHPTNRVLEGIKLAAAAASAPVALLLGLARLD